MTRAAVESLSPPVTSPTLSRRAAGLRAPRGFGDASLVAPAPDAIRLTAGVPAAELLPVAELQAALDELWRAGAAPRALAYSASPGIEPLRGWIARREGVDPGRVVITNGGMHGLGLAVEAFVEPGGTVVVDDPVFPLFLRVLDLVDAAVRPVPVGDEGLDVGRLEDLLRSGVRVDAVYTVPDFHNPSQGVLTGERRRALVSLAERHGFVVIVDNPYRELSFTGARPQVAVFHDSPNVVHVNTFTKTLGPGLRLGWLVLPEAFVEPVVQLRNRQDSHTSTLTQTVVHQMLASSPGWFDALRDRAAAGYRSRAEHLVAELRRQLPGAFELAAPAGGFFVWPRLVDDRVDAAALHEAARRHGVDYQRGDYFEAPGGGDHSRRLRLGFSAHPPERLTTAVGRLALAYDDVLRTRA